MPVEDSAVVTLTVPPAMTLCSDCLASIPIKACVHDPTVYKRRCDPCHSKFKAASSSIPPHPAYRRELAGMHQEVLPGGDLMWDRSQTPDTERAPTATRARRCDVDLPGGRCT